VKNCTKGKSGGKYFGLLAGRKRGCIFLARGIAENVREKSNEEKEEQEGLIAKLKMPIIFVKGSCFETPLYTMCWVTSGR
jgi:hypothetical protein